MRSSCDQAIRPRFIENAATSQKVQNAAHPTMKATSTTCTPCGTRHSSVDRDHPGSLLEAPKELDP